MSEIRNKRSAFIACRLLILLLLGSAVQADAAATKKKTSHPAAPKAVANDATAKAREILTSLTDHEPSQISRPMDRAAFEDRMRRSQLRRDKITAAESQLELLGPSIVPLVAQNLNNTDTDISSACGQVLGFFGPSVIPEVLANYTQPSKVQYVSMALSSMTAEALPAVLPMLKNESEAKRILGISLLDHLLSQNASNHYPINHVMAGGIPRSILFRPIENRHPLPEAFQRALCQITKAEKVATLRASMCDLLGMVGTGIPEVSETLISLASVDPEPTVRLESIKALGTIKVFSNDDRIDAALQKSSSDDSAEQCRAAAVDALVRTDSLTPENLNSLRRALSDRSKLVVSASMNGIYRLGLKARPLAPDLVKIIKDDPDSSTAADAIVALAMLQSPSANELDLFVKLLENPDTKIKNAALKALGKMHETATPVVPKLTSFLNQSDSDSSREAISALGEIGPGAAPAEDTLKTIAAGRGINSMLARQALKKIDPNYDPPPREVHKPATAPVHTEGAGTPAVAPVPTIAPVPTTAPPTNK